MNATKKIYQAPVLLERGSLVEKTLGANVIDTEASFPPYQLGE
jgi:hypothetical protein